jgi:hypothetical protein
MGFFMAQNDKMKMRIPVEGNEAKLAWVGRDGRGFFGFMFVIHASTIMADLQPD